MGSWGGAMQTFLTGLSCSLLISHEDSPNTESEMNDDEGVGYTNATREKGEKNDHGVMNADTIKGEAKCKEGYNEIQLLKQKLNQLQNEENWQEERHHDISLEEEEDEDINISIDDPEPVSEIEEKFQTDIDAILARDSSFWLRFIVLSSIRLLKNSKNRSLEDLRDEIGKAKVRR
ncbi:hypothetical protein Tco_1309272 [Tanacetum coccineum]